MPHLIIIQAETEFDNPYYQGESNLIYPSFAAKRESKCGGYFLMPNQILLIAASKTENRHPKITRQVRNLSRLTA